MTPCQECIFHFFDGSALANHALTIHQKTTRSVPNLLIEQTVAKSSRPQKQPLLQGMFFVWNGADLNRAEGLDGRVASPEGMCV